MKHINKFIFILIALAAFTSCKKYFDINADPGSPQNADLAAILPPILAGSGAQMAIDGGGAAVLSQNFTSNAGNGLLDIHSGNPGGGFATGFWRVFYVNQGTSINLILDKGITNENWDYVGVAYAMRAWGFQQATSYFGDMPFYQAWDPTRASFKYDKQEDIYHGIDSLCRTAIDYLSRTDGKVSQSGLSRGDIVYKGDRSKWIKFVYGILARQYNRLTNKSNYISEGYADSVIKFVGLSFSSSADNYLLPYPATKNDDTNPFGPARVNFNFNKQSRFVTHLLDGTIFSTPLGGTPPTTVPISNRDPRLRSMLSISADTVTPSANMSPFNGGYRYNILAATGGGDFEGNLTGGSTPGSPQWRRRPSVVYADSTPTNTGGSSTATPTFSIKAGRYIFQNNAPLTLMAYHELQFILAEALYRRFGPAAAQPAYENGVDKHFEFVNTYAALAGNTPPITSTQIAQYKTTPAFKNSANASTLTLTDIMLQKYIADWAWNPYETWSDIRRYHYFDVDPVTNDQVYRSFVIPFYNTNNQGPKPAYRFLPTNFSEFDWNEAEIRRLGGFNIDYHTYEMWYSQP